VYAVRKAVRWPGVVEGGAVSEVELPRGIALAWGIAADPQRGPKRELSIERIVEAAMEIADAEGLAAVSMSSVATRLGYTTMSLYRYVSAKDDLIVLMNDEGLGPPPDHDPVEDDWIAGLRRWAHALTGTYTRHPWLLDIAVDGIPMTPNSLAWLDWGLRLLAPARMAPNDAVAAVLMISGLIRWQSTIDRAVADDPWPAAAAMVFGELVTPERYPALAQAVAAGAMSDQDEDDPFAFALERALDGLSRVAGGAPLPEPPPAPEPDYPRDAKLREATRARREADAKLREAVRKERELIAKARERLAKDR
jgi:AcrR family transcriptional regulator